MINPFRYRSYYYDKETKLYYLNSRYYNPEWGRFINGDNLILQNTNTLLSNNLYLYCDNNVINNTDKNGHHIFTANIELLKEYSYSISDIGSNTVMVEIEIGDSYYVATMSNNAIHFAFSENPDLKDNGYTIATALYEAYHDFYLEDMTGRTFAGIKSEIVIHKLANDLFETLKMEKLNERSKIADIGTTKSDNNAWIFKEFTPPVIVIEDKKSKTNSLTQNYCPVPKKPKSKNPFREFLGWLGNLFLIL